MTPEGEVKQRIRKVLVKYRDRGVYWHMPVQNGMGSPTLDVVGCVNGRYFAIEAKRAGGKPTARQQRTAYEIMSAGGSPWLIDGDDALKAFENWLQESTVDHPQADKIRRVGEFRPEGHYFYPART